MNAVDAILQKIQAQIDSANIQEKFAKQGEILEIKD
jgi:hypothetical protein